MSRPRPVDAEGRLLCSRCDTFKAPEDFPVRTSSPDGRNSCCKICHNLETARWKAKTLDEIVDEIEERWASQPEPSDASADLTDQLRSFFGDSWTPTAWQPNAYARRKVIACGDLHADPNRELTMRIIEAQPDIVVVGGDLLDGAESNSHVKLPGDPRPKGTRYEMAVVRAWLQAVLANTQAEIKIVHGNHDDRAWKKAAEVLPDYLLELFSDPLEVVAYGLPRTEMVKTDWVAHMPNGQVGDYGYSQYMLPLGDVLFSHANFTGTEPLVAARKLMMWHAKWRRTLGVDPAIFVQFHCHSQGTGGVDGGHVLLVEPGMLANPAAEAWKLRFDLKWKPGVMGALCLEQDYIDGEWITDRRTIKIMTP